MEIWLVRYFIFMEAQIIIEMDWSWILETVDVSTVAHILVPYKHSFFDKKTRDKYVITSTRSTSFLVVFKKLEKQNRQMLCTKKLTSFTK